MKLTFALCFLLPVAVYANQPDSKDYDQQRERVNALLKERSKRFGDFDKSLQSKTGIFGLKTKKDMQASIDILEEIVLNDNRIFKETKALLEFKDIEQRSISNSAQESRARIDGYVRTISKMQKNQEALSNRIDALEKQNGLYLTAIVILGILSALLLFLSIGKRPRNKINTKG